MVPENAALRRRRWVGGLCVDGGAGKDVIRGWWIDA